MPSSGPGAAAAGEVEELMGSKDFRLADRKEVFREAAVQDPWEVSAAERPDRPRALAAPPVDLQPSGVPAARVASAPMVFGSLILVEAGEPQAL